MSKVIEFPNQNRNRKAYPICGALALAPQEIEDSPAEIPSEEPKHQVEVIPFPGAWESDKADVLPSTVRNFKIRSKGPSKPHKNFSKTYESLFFPLSADAYRLASRSPPNMVVCDAENPYKFVSRQYDVQADLYYLRARYYSARNGRFLTQDPFLGDPYDPQTLHRYTYAYNNPVTYYDLDGYFAVQAVSSLAGFVGGIVNAGFESIHRDATISPTQVAQGNITAPMSLADALHRRGVAFKPVLADEGPLPEHYLVNREALQRLQETDNKYGYKGPSRNKAPGAGDYPIKVSGQTQELFTPILAIAFGLVEMFKATLEDVQRYGSKGAPDHQQKVEELVDKAQREFPNDIVVREKRIVHPESHRRPDVQVIDKTTGQVKKVYEAERHPTYKRNVEREAEYKRLNIPYETDKVGK